MGACVLCVLQSRSCVCAWSVDVCVYVYGSILQKIHDPFDLRSYLATDEGGTS